MQDKKILERLYFDNLVDDGGLPEEFYEWLTDLSLINNKPTHFFVNLALEDLYSRLTQEPTYTDPPSSIPTYH